MRVGFGTTLDSDHLRSLGCERLFLFESDATTARVFLEAIEFLRSGDTLVVIGLERLGTSIDSLLDIAEHLWRQEITLVVSDNETDESRNLPEGFLQSCAILKEVRSKFESLKNKESGRRNRGRPPSLSPADLAKIERLFREERASVLEISRLLRVSPATIYRHFPGRRPVRSAHGKTMRRGD